MSDAKSHPQARVIDSREQDQLADDVMDLLAAGPDHTPEPSRRDAERERREERAFLTALARGLHDRLAELGVHVLKIAADGIGAGYEIFARDSVGRPYQVTARFDDLLAACAASEAEGKVRAAIDHVGAQILKARQRYYERAGL
jgi:hypothetical protein